MKGALWFMRKQVIYIPKSLLKLQVLCLWQLDLGQRNEMFHVYREQLRSWGQEFIHQALAKELILVSFEDENCYLSGPATSPISA